MNDETTPRERRAERTRKAILDAAMQLIVENGPDNLSLREVARRIDYSPAGLYEYFDGKDDLVSAACQEADVRLTTYLGSVPDDLPTVDYLVELGLAYIRFARENPEHFFFLFNNRDSDFSYLPVENHETVNDAWQENDRNFALLYNAVRRAVNEGIFHTQSDYGMIEIAYTIWAMGHGLAMLQAKYLCHMPVDYQVTDRHALRMVITGLGK